MYRLSVWINDVLNRSNYDVAFRAWAERKKKADEHNRRLRSDPTFRHDAFGHQKLANAGPPPDASKYMSRSLSDNWVYYTVFCTVAAVLLGSCVLNALFGG